MGRGKRELVEWGFSTATRVGQEVLPEVRKRVARWRDPRARLLRKRRWAKRTATGGGLATGVFGAGAVGSGMADFVPALLQYSAATGFGGLAVLSGAGAVGAGLRYRRLKREPLPEAAPEPVELPPSDSAAREPMRRLRDAEQSLHQALERLRGAAVVSDSVAVTEARGTADATARELRHGADRLVAVEAAREHVPDEQRAQLDEDVRRLRGELDEGVEEYGKLVAAAGRAVAASDAPEQRDLLQDATDRLAGLAAGLREVLGDAGAGGTAPPLERPPQGEPLERPSQEDESR
ncbi:phage shock envelope stress response protein PspM [Salinifilum ghardaiensis]